MSQQYKIYDAFTGISTLEKSVLTKFICQHSEDCEQDSIAEALDYAVKNKPSFGGFVYTLWTSEQLTAAVVVNKTGMSGFKPSFLIVFAVLDTQRWPKDAHLLKDLLQQVVDYANGEIALQLRPNNPTFSLFKQIGFEEHYVELRHSSPGNAASA